MHVASIFQSCAVMIRAAIVEVLRYRLLHLEMQILLNARGFC